MQQNSSTLFYFILMLLEMLFHLPFNLNASNDEFKNFNFFVSTEKLHFWFLMGILGGLNFKLLWGLQDSFVSQAVN